MLRPVALVLVTLCVNCLAWGDFPSYEDRMMLKVNPPQTQPKRETETLLDLKSTFNKAHDAEFLKKMGVSSGNLLGSESRLLADNYNVSGTCLSQWNRSITALMNSEFWAIKLFDAAAKIESGILEGNTKWLGSYDECFQINQSLPGMPESSSGIQTQFCGVEIPLKIGFTPLKVDAALCAPKACSPEDLKHLYNDMLSNIENLLGRNSSFRVSGVFCQEKPEIDTRAIVAIVILGIFAAFMLIGTLYDIVYIQWQAYRYKDQDNLPENEKSPLIIHEKSTVAPIEESTLRKLLLSFSVYSNGKKLLQVNQSAGTLTSLNGIRFLSISWVVLGHTFVFSFNDFSNTYTAVPDFMKRWSFQAVLNALVSVDSFFALSGLLLAYLTLKEMKKGKGMFRINWFMFYFHRFWRLTPVYMMIVMISICLSRYFGDGPLWPEKGFENNYCENTWWKNLLYINNLFNQDQSCFGVSWYLANDMQFFILSPLMLVPLYFHYPLGICVCCIWLLGSAIAPGVVSNVLDLPPSSVGGGGSDQGRADYMTHYYIKPYCRMGPYIVGIIVGSLLYKTDCKVKINKYLNLLLWLIFATLAILVLYGLRDAFNYPEDALSRDVSALYNATHKIVWGACVCWVIFACATGNGGFINTLLSWSPFIPLARLSYCIYLTHSLVLSTYSGSQRTPIYLNDINIIYMFLGNLVLSTMTAFIASVSFESPMMGLEKVILKRQRRN